MRRPARPTRVSNPGGPGDRLGIWDPKVGAMWSDS